MIQVNHQILFIDNNWITSYSQLRDILKKCSDASSLLAKEFIELSMNGTLSAWLEQIGKIKEANALLHLVNNDDDKEYIDSIKRIILDEVDDSDSKRPNLADYAKLISVYSQLNKEGWKEVTSKKVILPKEPCRCNLKFVFRPKKSLRLTYPLSFIVSPTDPDVINDVLCLLKKDPGNYRKDDAQLREVAISQTSLKRDDVKLRLAGKSSEEEIEILFEDILPVGRMRTEYNYNLQLNVVPDENIWSKECCHQEKDTLSFEVDGVRFDMKRVEGGVFLMGAQRSSSRKPNYDEDASYSESPIHSVQLDAFYIGETVVTQALWKVVSDKAAEFEWWWKRGGNGYGDNNPAYNVTWDDCKEFVRRLNKKLSFQLPDGYEFSMPTEAQWEFAARGGNEGVKENFKYSGSNDSYEVAWFHNNSGGRIHPVKEEGKIPNILDVYGMSGNVCEWCEDEFYSYSKENAVNPIHKGSKSSVRVHRGGSWADSDDQCRVTNRSYSSAEDRTEYKGFRLALVRNSDREPHAEVSKDSYDYSSYSIDYKDDDYWREKQQEVLDYARNGWSSPGDPYIP
ncbi:MAG: SUMF1/EgtB/PvdO family nonheme iron enzyme [Paludibacteraceae bacterium]|nr:SUMF1/EgtB/PvdO family nonheme iron enzyme [Paludibacteraceae bacterium]